MSAGIMLALVTGFFFSMLASAVSKKNLNPPMSTKLFLPVALTFWKWAFPGEVRRLMKPSKEELESTFLFNGHTKMDTHMQWQFFV